MHTPHVVSPETWEAARRQLLVKEKAQTRARDALAAERRRMPWMAVDKAYAFETPTGRASLLDLFDGRRQLTSTAPSMSPACSAGRTTPAAAAPWARTRFRTRLI